MDDMKTWWLSYAGYSEGAVVIVDAKTFLEARTAVKAAGISPGGQVLGFPIEGEDCPPEYIEWAKTAPRLKVLRLNDLPSDARTLKDHQESETES